MFNDVSMTKWNVYIIATVVALGQNCAHVLRSIHVILIWLLLDLCETLYDEVLRRPETASLHDHHLNQERNPFILSCLNDVVKWLEERTRNLEAPGSSPFSDH